MDQPQTLLQRCLQNPGDLTTDLQLRGAAARWRALCALAANEGLSLDDDALQDLLGRKIRATGTMLRERSTENPGRARE